MLDMFVAEAAGLQAMADTNTIRVPRPVCHGVADGQAALNAIDEVKPDLVLLDIMLPEIDGFEVCRRIKSNSETKHIPVVMLTAKKSREDMPRGEQVGADWYITKPFKSAMVIETIQRFID